MLPGSGYFSFTHHKANTNYPYKHKTSHMKPGHLLKKMKLSRFNIKIVPTYQYFTYA